MSYDDPGAEVAEDFRTALEDMTTTTRVEIMNLCQIARENTEYALEISEALLKHINQTAPHRKLAAFYVLDAIIKNVGTPYTLYVAPKLYNTFMESYARVETNIRRKMEEMLKTWKEPVPGSVDKRPVFPPDVVTPIENALIKARTSAMQTLQQQRSNLPPHVIGRPPPGPATSNTPTPPGARPGSGQRGPQPFPPPKNGPPYPPQQQTRYGSPHGGAPPPQQFPGSQVYPTYGQGISQAAGQQTQVPGGPVDADMLGRKVVELIVATQTETSRYPHDASIQTRLKALVALQTLLQAKNLPPGQLELVKNQVDELAVKMGAAQTAGAYHAASSAPPAHTPTPPAAPPVSIPPALASIAPSLASLASLSSTGPPPPRAQPGSVSLDSILGAGALATLMARRSAPQASTPSAPPALNAYRSPPRQHAIPVPPVPVPVPPVSGPPQDAMALLARLRQAGMINSSGPSGLPVPPPSLPMPPGSTVVPGLPGLPPGLANLLPTPAVPPAHSIKSITWEMSSLQVIRTNLFPMLYAEQGHPCSQCGRRFKTNPEGKKQKTVHMDWHFRVRQRMVDAEKRAQYRSYYVSRTDWINSREELDLDFSHAESSSQQASADANKKPEEKFIPVPDPSSGINTECPICRDKFENKWLHSVQDWVWQDVILVKGRAYHASCHAMLATDRARGSTPLYGGGARATPEPLLGKRKLEGDDDKGEKRRIS